MRGSHSSRPPGFSAFFLKGTEGKIDGLARVHEGDAIGPRPPRYGGPGPTSGPGAPSTISLLASSCI